MFDFVFFSINFNFKLIICDLTGNRLTHFLKINNFSISDIILNLNSIKICPALTGQTHSLKLPFPLPIRTSAGLRVLNVYGSFLKIKEPRRFKLRLINNCNPEKCFAVKILPIKLLFHIFQISIHKYDIRFY